MPGSQMIRRRLARKLTKLRVERGMSQEAAAQEAGVRGSTVSRIEACKQGASVPVVKALCDAYQVDGDARKVLVTWTQAAGEKTGWWEEYDHLLPDWMRLYVELEDAADGLLIYEPVLVHGLLQTPGYAAAIFRGSARNSDPQATQAHVDIRLRRQAAILDRNQPPTIAAILDEAALMRPVGGDEVRREQIKHLCSLDERTGVNVRVLPVEVGAHEGMAGAFTVLRFDDPDDPDAVHLEQEVGAMYLEQVDGSELGALRPVETYLGIFDLLWRKSVPIAEWRTHDLWQTVA